MKKTFTTSKLIAVILLLIGNLSYAQDIEITWGKEEINKKKATYIGGVIGSDQNGYFFTREVYGGLFSGPTKTSVIRNNMDHETESTFELPSKINGKDAVRQGLYRINNETVLFLSQLDKKADVNKLYYVSLNSSGEKIEEKLVDEINYKGRKDKGSFGIHYLDDQKQFLITHNEGYSKKGNEEVNYKLYTEKLSLIWDKAIELPYKDKAFSIYGYQTDDNTNVFLYGSLTIDKKTERKTVFAYYHKTQKLEEVEVGFGKAARVSDVNYSYYDGALNFTGFYYDTKGGIQGVCITKINTNTLETILEKNVPFSKKDLLLFTTERNAKKGKGIIQNFDIKNIIVKENGDFFIVGESYQVVVTTYTDPKTGVTRTTYTYYYRDLMVVNVSKNLEIKWVSKVPKNQVSVNDGGRFSSFVLAYNEENFYFLFNDNPKNLSPKTKPEKKGKYLCATAKTKKSVVNLATVNLKNGELENEIFFKSKNKHAFIPKYQERLNSKQILVYAEKGKSYQFGILSVGK